MELDGFTLADICIEMEPRILEVIALNGGWENWIQIELALAIGQKLGVQVQIETKYEGNEVRYADISFAIEGCSYLIEVKTESPKYPGKFTGHNLAKAGGDDIFKLQGRQRDGTIPDFAWVLVVAYSPSSISIMEEQYNDTPPSFFRTTDKIAVSVLVADYY